jgi:xanthine phosphoribosyltransferase
MDCRGGEDNRGEAMSDRQRIQIHWDEIIDHSKALAWGLGLKTPTGGWKGIVAVARGGLSPAGLVSSHMNLRQVHTICAESYEGMQRKVLIRSSRQWDPQVGTGNGWILLDDLVDSGQTARVVRGLLPHAHFACLYAKPDGRPHTDTYIKLYEQNTWLDFPWEVT